MKFFKIGGEAIGRRLDAQFLGGEAADPLAIHGQQGCCGRRGHVKALFFKLYELGSGYGFHLGDDMVRLLLENHLAQGLGIGHVKHSRAIGHLHGRRVGIFIAGNDFYAKALQLKGYFFA